MEIFFSLPYILNFEQVLELYLHLESNFFGFLQSPEGNSVSASSSVKDVSGGVKSELSISGSASPDLSPSSATPASPVSAPIF